MIALVILLGGCKKPPPPPVENPALVEGAAVAPPSPAGTLADGHYQDARWPLTVEVPDGWTALVGSEAGDVRLSVTEPESRVTVEVKVTGALGPTPRDGCSWTFVDDARYRVVRTTREVRVATCTPFDAQDVRVFGVYLAGEAAWVELEATMPPGKLLAGRAAVERVAGEVRFR